MEKYTFEIEYVLKNDIKNWLAAVNEGEFEEKKWKDGLYGYYLEEFEKIVSMKNSKKVEKEIEDFVLAHFGEYIFGKQQEIEAEYTEKFLDVCEYIERLTGKALAVKHIKIYLTTFPRAPYSLEDGVVYFCIFWNNAVGILLHELLHMQVIKHWRENKKSDISKLNEKDFVFLNESLTFLINDFDDLSPNVKIDTGYEKHLTFRNELKKYWNKGCNFEELLSFSVAHIREYSVKRQMIEHKSVDF